MKRTFPSILALCLISVASFAQFEITSAGLSFENQNYQNSFTVGEVFNQRIETAAFSLKNGILQPAFKTPSSVYSTQRIEVSLYPNPVFDYLNVEVENREEFTYSIFDYTGKMVKRDYLAAGKISVAELTDGMYVLTLVTKDNSRFSYKFIK